MPPLLELPDIRQKDGFSCGEVALKIVLSYYSGKSVRKPARSCPIKGLHPSTLHAVFRWEGYKTVAGNMLIEDLKLHHSLGRPVICVIQSDGVGHYVVSSGVRRNQVHYQCPTYGLCKKNAYEFLTKWYDYDSDGNEFRQWGVAVWY